MSKAAIAEKEKFVDAFAEELKAAKAILVINYLGLTVEEVTNMRKELRDNDVKTVSYTHLTLPTTERV